MDDQVETKFSEALNATMKDWLAANAPASMKPAELEALMLEVVKGLVVYAARFSQSMPGPVRLSGHQFQKLAEVAFKEVARER